MGFDSTDSNDNEIMSDLVAKLQTHCDHINTFAIVVNGAAARLDGSFESMLKIFENMFEKSFWKNVVIIFTRVPMNKKDIQMRKGAADGVTDDGIAKKYLFELHKKFPAAPRNLKYVFIDAWALRRGELEEKDYFEAALQKLWKFVDKAGSVKTQNWAELELENKELKEKIKQATKNMSDEQKRQ